MLRTNLSVLRIGFCFVCLLILVPSTAPAQTDSIDYRPGIYFPQAPRPGQWRKSLGLAFTATPPELTEEIRASVPAIDFNIQRGISRHFFLTGRLQAQFLQNNGTIGLRWATPFSHKLFVALGDDMSGWFGVFKFKDVFNSQSFGWQNMPNVSLGYRPGHDLQITLKAEAILNGYYQSSVGVLTVKKSFWLQNGYAFTVMLEQPYYRKRHVSLGIRAAYSRFNWQFWSFYSTFDKQLFYPDFIFNFIL